MRKLSFSYLVIKNYHFSTYHNKIFNTKVGKKRKNDEFCPQNIFYALNTQIHKKYTILKITQKYTNTHKIHKFLKFQRIGGESIILHIYHILLIHFIRY